MIGTGPEKDKPTYIVKSKKKEIEVHAEEIAAYILTEMKQIAEKHLKKPVNKAVITVPAYFTDAQRTVICDFFLSF